MLGSIRLLCVLHTMVMAMGALSTDRLCQKAEAQRMQSPLEYRPVYYNFLQFFVKSYLSSTTNAVQLDKFSACN